MSEPFLGEIKVISFNFAPRGWAFCDGQLVPINQNQALFSILGTAYGGDGQTTFGLPNLQGRMPVHPNQNYPLGMSGGEETHTLTAQEMPAHNHVPMAAAAASAASPANAVWAASSTAVFASSPNQMMNPAAIGTAGGSQPHENLPPYLVLNFVIALVGIFPSRN